MIRISTTNGEELNLQVDMRLSIEETSVFDGKQGGYSLPLELPYTSHNAEVLGMPSNIARKQRFTTSVDVIISAGVWVRYAKLEVTEAIFRESILCTLYLRESPFYSKIEGMQLPDVFKDKVVRLYPEISDFNKRMSYIIQHMQYVMVGREVADYFVFPVCANEEHQEKDESESNASLIKRWTRYKILNQQVVPSPYNKFGVSARYQDKDYWILQGSRSEYEEGEVVYRQPTGYGITPFLKFTYILRQVFTHLGYTLQSSIFDTDASFKKMCLLNNTIDAIVTGVIDYSQLVPDVGVSQFFEFVENSFGCEFVIDEMHKTATPLFWNDLLSSKSTMSLSKKYEDSPSLSLKQPETVKLTVNRANVEATPITFSSYQEMVERYGEPIHKANYKDTVNYMWDNGINDGDFFYYFADKFCYMLFTGGYFGPRYVVEKDTLDYFDTSDTYTLKEINTQFEAVPMKDVAAGGVTGVRADFEMKIGWLPMGFQELINAEYSKAFSTEDGLIAKMPFIDSYRHLNSVYQKTQTKGDTQLITEEDEAEVDLPIIPCFYYGLARFDSNMPGMDGTVWGSTHRYDNHGTVWGTFNLTTKSLYDKFWKRYDSVIRTSYHAISGKAHLDVSEVMRLSFDKQHLLDNQTVLPTSIQYEVSDSGIEVTNLTVKTTKVYE